MEKHKDKINWGDLCSNTNAIHLIEEFLHNDPLGLLQSHHNTEDSVSWWMMSRNPNAVNLLAKNIGKVEWDQLTFNPSIFEIDVKKYN